MNYDAAPDMQHRKQYSIYGSKIFPSTDNGVSAYYTIEVIIHKIFVYQMCAGVSAYYTIEVIIHKIFVGFPGLPQALEIMENLENHEKNFHAWKNHRI